MSGARPCRSPSRRASPIDRPGPARDPRSRSRPALRSRPSARARPGNRRASFFSGFGAGRAASRGHGRDPRRTRSTSRARGPRRCARAGRRRRCRARRPCPAMRVPLVRHDAPGRLVAVDAAEMRGIADRAADIRSALERREAGRERGRRATRGTARRVPVLPGIVGRAVDLVVALEVGEGERDVRLAEVMRARGLDALRPSASPSSPRSSRRPGCPRSSACRRGRRTPSIVTGRPWSGPRDFAARAFRVGAGRRLPAGRVERRERRRRSRSPSYVSMRPMK